VIGGSLAENGKWYASVCHLLARSSQHWAGDGCFVCVNPSGATIIPKQTSRHQPPDMCLQHDDGDTLPASQDATCNTERDAQENGHHVSACQVMPSCLNISCRGNILVIGSTTSIVIALTWGGVLYLWSSAHVISPLVFGLVGLGVFAIYEIYFCKPPVVSPFAT